MVAFFLTHAVAMLAGGAFAYSLACLAPHERPCLREDEETPK